MLCDSTGLSTQDFGVLLSEGIPKKHSENFKMITKKKKGQGDSKIMSC